MKPNRENIAKWVHELRTTEAPQATGQLRVPEADSGTHQEAFCCLGIACEVAAREGVVVRRPEGYASSNREDDFSSTVLPRPVAEWLGMGNTACDVVLHETNGTQVGATYFNDNMGKTFAEIADAIEREYLQ